MEKDSRFRGTQIQQCGWPEEYVKCFDYVSKIDISFTASSAERGRYEHSINILCGSEETNTGPRRERPNWKEVVTKANKFAKENWNREYISLDQLKKMKDTLDPKVKEHLTWLNKNYSSNFKETKESSSSSATSRSSSWWVSCTEHHSWGEWHEHLWKEQEWWTRK